MKSTTFLLILSSFINFSLNAQVWEPLGGDDFNRAYYREGSQIAHDINSSDGSIYTIAETENRRPVVRRYKNNKWVTVGSNQLDSSFFNRIAIKKDDGVPYIVLSGPVNNKHSKVFKLSNNNWVPVGVGELSAYMTSSNQIQSDELGNIYVAFTEHAPNETRLIVKKLINGNWISVGQSPVVNNIQVFHFKLDGNGIPYFAYIDEDDVLFVKKLENNEWVQVGQSSDVNGHVFEAKLAFGNNNTPFIAYSIFFSFSEFRIQKLVNNSWQNVGDTQSVWGNWLFFSLAIDNENIPYIAYNDSFLGPYALSTKKFDGAAWVYVDEPGFSVSRTKDVELSIGIDGAPILTYSNLDYAAYASVKSLENNKWEYIEDKDVLNGFFAGLGRFNVTTQDSTIYINSFVKKQNDTYDFEIAKSDNHSWDIIYENSANSSNSVSIFCVSKDGRIFLVGKGGFPVSPIDTFTIYELSNSQLIPLERTGLPDKATIREMKIDSENILNLLYEQHLDGDSSLLYLKKFVNNEWVNIGVDSSPIGITGLVGGIHPIDLEISNANIPVVFYRDLTLGRFTVKHFINGEWKLIGNQEDQNFCTSSLSLDGNGNPFLVSKNCTFGAKVIQANYYNGAEWVASEPLALGKEQPFFYDSAMGDDSLFYLAYTEYEQGGKVGILTLKYENGAIELVKQEVISSTLSENIQLLKTSNGELVVVYSDDSYSDAPSKVWAKKLNKSLSKTTEKYTDSEISLFPNPCYNKLFCPAKINLSSVYIVDCYGRNISTQLVNDAIDVSKLESGIYFLVLKHNDGTKQVSKFMKL